MMKQYHPGMQVPFVTAPLGMDSGPLMMEAYRNLEAAGVDVAFDSRTIPFADKAADWDETGTVAIVCNDADAPYRKVGIHSTANYDLRRRGIDVREAWELIMQAAGVEVPEFEAVEVEADPEPEASVEIDAAPITPLSPAAPVPADEPIRSWALDDPTWVEELSAKRLETIQKAKAAWSFGLGKKFAVRVGDRIYLTATDASIDHGWVRQCGLPTPGLCARLRERKTEYNGYAIGYADPALEAIRLGKTREEYRGAHDAAKEKPLIKVNGTQGSVVDSPAVKAAMKTVKREDPAPEGEAVAMIVVQADGSLGLDRELDFATAARVLEFFRAAADKGGKVAI